MSHPTSNQQFTREQIEFIRNEMYASLSCGASDPLFQAIYDRAAEVLRSRDETSREQRLEALVFHLRHCRECGETDIQNCYEGWQLWSAAAMPISRCETGAGDT